MEITFSINNRKVEKAVFKTFSSQCEKWINIIADKQQQIGSTQGKMDLIYYPAWNIVVPVCKPSFLLSSILDSRELTTQTAVERIMNSIKLKMQFLKMPHNVSSLEKV